MNDLFDSNILIDHLNGIKKATKELQRSDDLAISVITWIEVMCGAENKAQQTILRAFLTSFQCLPVTSAVAERGAEIRRVKKIKLPDAIILATAQAAGRTLVTRNVRDFPTSAGGVRVPYRI